MKQYLKIIIPGAVTLFTLLLGFLFYFICGFVGEQYLDVIEVHTALFEFLGGQMLMNQFNIAFLYLIIVFTLAMVALYIVLAVKRRQYFLYAFMGVSLLSGYFFLLMYTQFIAITYELEALGLGGCLLSLVSFLSALATFVLVFLFGKTKKYTLEKPELDSQYIEGYEENEFEAEEEIKEESIPTPVVEEEKVVETPVEEEVVEEKPAPVKKLALAKKPAAPKKAPVKKPEPKKKEAPKAQPKAPVGKQKAINISFREELNKWEAKLDGSEKALKLFATQKDAIEYCEQVALNNGYIVAIHTLKGRVRTYDPRASKTGIINKYEI